MKIKKNIITYFMVICLLLGSSISAFAAGNHELLQINTKDNQIIAYVKGEENTDALTCQIGMIPCENVDVSKFSEGNIVLHTVVLFDNSLSINKENKQKAVSVLQAYFESKNPNEYITLATFGEDFQIITEKTTDSTSLISGLTSIQHNDQDTYLTDVLYEYLDNLNDDEFTRFVVMSDGVDNKAIGITKDELLEKLKKNAHPIYTLGHIYKNNESELENMFALSRATGGATFLLDEISDNSVIINELTNVDDFLCLKVEIPADIQDGSTKNILYTIPSESGVSEIKAEVEMPFSIKEETESSEEETTIVEEPEEETVPEPVPVPETTEEETTIVEEVVEEEGNSATPFAAIVLIAAAAFLLLKNKKGKGKKSEKQTKESKKKGKKANISIMPVSTPFSETDSDSTVLFTPDMDATVMLDRRYMLVLRDIHDSNKIFKYPLDTSITLGRNVDMVNIAIDYNRTVSGKHCEIYVRNGRFYVRDLNSANKTYVNGRVIQMDTEIQSGCMIALGEVELSVEIIPI